MEEEGSFPGKGGLTERKRSEMAAFFSGSGQKNRPGSKSRPNRFVICQGDYFTITTLREDSKFPAFILTM
jgi:hypothetical protein